MMYERSLSICMAGYNNILHLCLNFRQKIRLGMLTYVRYIYKNTYVFKHTLESWSLHHLFIYLVGSILGRAATFTDF